MVGGDKFVSEILNQIHGTNASLDENDENAMLADRLARLIEVFDKEYRHVLEEYRYGNQIRLVISR